MALSWSGIFAILMAVVAVAFTSLSFALPYWSTNDSEASIFNDELKAEMKYGAGVWGICLELDFNLQAPSLGVNISDVDKCYLYYSSNKYELVDQTNVQVQFREESVCDALKNDKLPVALRFLNRQFLEDTCGSLGKTSLAFAIIALSFSVLMLASLMLGLICCKKNNCFMQLAGTLGFIAFASTIVSWAVWIKQSDELNDQEDTSFGVSFAFQIVASVMFFLTYIFTKRHIKLGKREEERDRNMGYHQRQTPAAAGQATNLV